MKFKNFILLVLQYLIAAIILYFIFTFINLSELRNVFNSISFNNLVTIFLISLLIQYLHIARWGFILKIIENKISWLEICKSYFIGTTAGFVSPGQIGEFFARKINLQNHSIAKITFFTFVDKIYLLNSTLFLGAVGIFCLALTFLSIELKIFSGLVFVIIIGLSFAFIFTKLFYTILLRFSNYIKKYFHFETELVNEVDFPLSTRFRLFTNTIIIQLLIFYQFYYLIQLFDTVNFLDVFIGASSVYFLKTFVFFSGIGDLGVREGLAILCFEKFGISSFVAVTSSLLIFVFNLLIPALLGVVFLIFHKFIIKK